jgi:hypothetical protein
MKSDGKQMSEWEDLKKLEIGKVAIAPAPLCDRELKTCDIYTHGN